jgi:hypothetical protein
MEIPGNPRNSIPAAARRDFGFLGSIEEKMMAHDQDPESQPQPHQHSCGNLFGCGDEKGTGVLREDIKDSTFTTRAADHLRHLDEINQAQFDDYLSARGRSRRRLLRGSSFMGALAAIGPWFTKLVRAADSPETNAAVPDGNAAAQNKEDEGRVHVVESNDQTVRLGVYDTTLPPILKIDSGDTLSFPNTWSHYLNQMQPGVPIAALVKIRVSNPGKGPHSIIGPIYVNNAEPGDVLEVRYKRILPFNWGAVFNNPGSLGTGLLPQDFPEGQIKYLDRMRAIRT